MKRRMLTLLATLCVALSLMPVCVSAASKPAAPKATVSNTASSGKAKLKWKKVKGAKKYTVYRATSKKGTYKKLTTTTKTYYTDSSASVGKKYYYKVKAVDADGDKSSYSSAVSATRDLARPDVKAANTASSGKVKLTWDKVNGAKEYVIYRATSKDDKYKEIKTTTKNYYTDSSATVGKTYYYQVKAVHKKSAANSALSSADKGVRDLARPDVTVKLNSNDQPRITWDEIEDAEEYAVYRSTSQGGTYKKIKTTSGESYTDKSVEAGKTYYYKVKAIHEKSSANSAYSSVKKITIPKADDFQETIILDDENCIFKFVSIEKDDIWGYTLKAYLENKTDMDLMFTLDDVSVNGFMCDPFWASTVTAGMKSFEEISFSLSDFEANGITDVTEIEFTLRVYDDNDWDAEYLVNDVYTFYPKGKAAHKEYIRTPIAGETILFDNDDVTMIVTGYDPDNEWGYTVNVYLENKTDTTILVGVDDVAVNGYMCDPFWADSIAPGKRSNTTITWSEDAFEDNYITEVETITLPVYIYDDEEWEELMRDTFTLIP